MGIQYTPQTEGQSPEMQAIIAKLKAIKADPNAKPLNFDDFNFKKSQEMLKHVIGNLSDAVIEERRGRGGEEE